MRSTKLGATAAAVVLAVSVAGPVAAEIINGTSGPDVLVGTRRADTIRGFGGADDIYARAGADQVYTGRDNRRDHVYGRLGKDRITVRLGDTVYAGGGNDVVRVRLAAWKMTHVYCGPGYDRLYGYNPWVVAQRGCEKVD